MQAVLFLFASEAKYLCWPMAFKNGRMSGLLPYPRISRFDQQISCSLSKGSAFFDPGCGTRPRSFISSCRLYLCESIQWLCFGFIFGNWSNLQVCNFSRPNQQKITEDNVGSIIFSPSSIQSVLSLLSFGAEGATKEEMLKGMKYPPGYTSDQIAKNYEAFTASIKNNSYLKVGTVRLATRCSKHFR